MREKWGRSLYSIFVGFLCFYFAMLASMYIGQRKMMYYPDPNRQSLAAFRAEDMNVVTIDTADGLELEAWYKAPEENKPVIVVFHGNASHMGMSAWKVRDFVDKGYGALLPAYRGYAGNPGKPNEKGFYLDGRATIEFLLDKGYEQNNIVLLGESLGSGIAVEIAARHYKDLRAIILESPYTSFPDLARKHYPFVPLVDILVRDQYKSIDKISAIHSPLLVVHGKRDMIVPYEFGKMLFEKANEPKHMLSLDGAGHNDLYLHGASQKIIAFLEQISK
jgi:hypothetical protein